jgi:hypothetical protein
MRVQLAQQAQEILGTSDLVMITERVDDVALLIGQMVKMGLPEVLDRHIPRHWTQTRAQLGVDSRDLAGLYRHGRRSPESIGGNLPQRHAPYPEPPDRTGHRAARFERRPVEPSAETLEQAGLLARDRTRPECT